MRIRIKIGTHPASYMHVCRKQHLPSLGDTIKVKSANHSWIAPEQVIIDQIIVINGEVLFYAYRM